MKSAYLITEHKETALILEHLLPQFLVESTEIVAMNTRYSAQSLAGTLMSERVPSGQRSYRPVALVLNADTTDKSAIQEQFSLINTLLLPAANRAPYQVFLAVPTAASFIPQETESPTSLLEQLDHLSADQIQSLRQQPLLQQLTQFLANACTQAA
ncbi:MAG: hypothetical protein H0X31_15815 [Nostocaceae cyanobacterium]|nr:hypothetical protein [Nostocaceae cyanobacterium]